MEGFLYKATYAWVLWLAASWLRSVTVTVTFPFCRVPSDNRTVQIRFARCFSRVFSICRIWFTVLSAPEAWSKPRLALQSQPHDLTRMQNKSLKSATMTYADDTLASRLSVMSDILSTLRSFCVCKIWEANKYVLRQFLLRPMKILDSVFLSGTNNAQVDPELTKLMQALVILSQTSYAISISDVKLVWTCIRTLIPVDSNTLVVFEALDLAVVCCWCISYLTAEHLRLRVWRPHLSAYYRRSE